MTYVFQHGWDWLVRMQGFTFGPFPDEESGKRFIYNWNKWHRFEPKKGGDR